MERKRLREKMLNSASLKDLFEKLNPVV